TRYACGTYLLDAQDRPGRAIRSGTGPGGCLIRLESSAVWKVPRPLRHSSVCDGRFGEENHLLCRRRTPTLRSKGRISREYPRSQGERFIPRRLSQSDVLRDGDSFQGGRLGCPLHGRGLRSDGPFNARIWGRPPQVVPGKQSKSRSRPVCGRIAGRTVALVRSGLRAGTGGRHYRPGHPLQDTRMKGQLTARNGARRLLRDCLSSISRNPPIVGTRRSWLEEQPFISITYNLASSLLF